MEQQNKYNNGIKARGELSSLGDNWASPHSVNNNTFKSIDCFVQICCKSKTLELEFLVVQFGHIFILKSSPFMKSLVEYRKDTNNKIRRTKKKPDTFKTCAVLTPLWTLV